MKLLKKLALGVLTSVFVLGAATVATDDRTKREAPVEAAVVAGTYTYDFTTNFSTYASSWTNTYAAHTVNSDQIGTGLPLASFEWTAVNKSGTTITDRPVSKASNLTVKLLETGFVITHFEATFLQWTTKTKGVYVYEGENNTGTQLFGVTDIHAVGSTTGLLTVQGAAVNAMFLDMTNTNQVGYTSVTITIAEQVGDVPVNSIEIDPNPIIVALGDTEEIDAHVLPSNATDSSLTWTLTNVNPAGAVTFDSATLTVTGNEIGTATLTATANDGSGVTDTATIEVIDAYIIELTEVTAGTNALTTTTILSHVTRDGLDMTYTTVTNIYRDDADLTALKFGTSSANGQLIFSLPAGYAIERVFIEAKPWGGETAAKLSLNDSTAVPLVNPNYEFYAYDVPMATTLKIDATKRLFITRIYMEKRVVTDQETVDSFVTNFMHPEIAYTDGTSGTACLDYYPLAKGAFNAMTLEQRTLFATDAAYADPLTRLQTWATINGDELDLTSYTLVTVAPLNFHNQMALASNNALLISFGLLMFLGLGLVFYYRRRKHSN